jgi:propionyl-CoA synthetase
MAKHKPDKCIIYQRKDFKIELDTKNEIDWNDAIKDAKPVECVEMNANDYAYILIHLEQPVHQKELLEISVDT